MGFKKNIEIFTRADHEIVTYKTKCPLISPEQMCSFKEDIEFVKGIKFDTLLPDQVVTVRYIRDTIVSFNEINLKQFDVFDSKYTGISVKSGTDQSNKLVASVTKRLSDVVDLETKN